MSSMPSGVLVMRSCWFGQTGELLQPVMGAIREPVAPSQTHSHPVKSSPFHVKSYVRCQQRPMSVLMGGMQAVLGQCSGITSSSVSIAFGQTMWPHTSRRGTLVFDEGFSGLISHSQDKYFDFGSAPEASGCVQDEHEPRLSEEGSGHLQDVEVGVMKVNKGSVLAEVVVSVVDACQFGHTGVSHLVIALTDCPGVWEAQVQDHEDVTGAFFVAFGMTFTRVQLPRLSTLG